jgi:hypothetical protein
VSATATICQLLQTEQVGAAAPANKSPTFLIGLPLGKSVDDFPHYLFDVSNGLELYLCE